MVFLACGATAQSKTNDSAAKTKPLVVEVVDVRPTSSLKFIATAYSLRGRMANGQKVHYGAIAADHRILPLGTIVVINGMGTFVVKDSGGAIKGNRIDIWMPSAVQARKFGRRTVVLKILSKPRKV